jgi:hypothetical protein
MATIKLVLPDDELANVDRIRGTTSRESWIRDLLSAAVTARDQFDGPCWLRIRATERPGDQPESVHFFAPIDD